MKFLIFSAMWLVTKIVGDPTLQLIVVNLKVRHSRPGFDSRQVHHKSSNLARYQCTGYLKNGTSAWNVRTLLMGLYWLRLGEIG
jgi:hypothetical protein